MPAVWGELTPEEFLAPLDGTLISGKPHTVLAGLSTDSRNIRHGELFWALRGERYDGHDFIEKAIERGAAGVLVQKDYLKAEEVRSKTEKKANKITNFGPQGPVVVAVDDTLKALGDLAKWWRHRHNIQVVAITGSAGKTTTKEMAASILELGNRTLKNQGNFNNLIGLPLTLLQLEEGYGKAVLEMGMNRPGEIARLTEIADPDVGVITNVGMAHLEGLRDLQGVAKAKLELAEKISSRGKIVLNGEDELLIKNVAPFQREIITFGFGRKNDVSASGITTLARKGISFKLHYRGDSWALKLRVPGIHNVINALAAAAVSLCLNEPTEHIVEGLGRYEGIKGRFKVSSLPGNVVLVDDTYNANPSSLKAALGSVRSLVDEGVRIIAGLGEMTELGDATIPAHQEAGRMVAELGVHLFLAIGEHAHEMTGSAVRAGMLKDRVEVVFTHGEMLKRIMEEMREGDLIFLKASRKVGLEKVVEGLTRCKH